MTKVFKGLRKRLPKSQIQQILPEVKSVTTIDLACKAENVIEKLIWLSLGILGIIWAAYFVALIIQDENPVVKVELDVPLTEIRKPAITICNKGSTKYGIVERLGNHLDSKDLPGKVSTWYAKMILCRMLYNGPSFVLSYQAFRKVCPSKVQTNNTSCEESIQTITKKKFMQCIIVCDF